MVQEYVDHGGRVWKVYVAGDQARCAAALTLCCDAVADLPCFTYGRLDAGWCTCSEGSPAAACSSSH